MQTMEDPVGLRIAETMSGFHDMFTGYCSIVKQSIQKIQKCEDDISDIDWSLLAQLMQQNETTIGYLLQSSKQLQDKKDDLEKKQDDLESAIGLIEGLLTDVENDFDTLNGLIRTKADELGVSDKLKDYNRNIIS